MDAHSKNVTSISLLERVQSATTEENWREFLALYGPMIDRFLRNWGVHHQDIEDLHQDVMAILLRELPRFEHNGRVGAFRNWLRQLTSHRLRTFRRKSWREPQTGVSVYETIAAQLADNDSPLTREWNREHDEHVLAQLLAQLPADTQSREIFRRVVIEQQPVEQVASNLGVSLNAIAIAKSRVLKELRCQARGLVDLDN